MSNLVINPEFPVGNAAGWCKSVSEVKALAQSTASFIVVGSITLKQRDGNPGNVFNGDLYGGLNSLGLPNPGIERIREIGPEMCQIAHKAGKPIIMSVAGLTPYEFETLTRAAHKIGFDGVELNMGCGNIADEEERKPVISFRRKLVCASLEAASLGLSMTNADWFVSVKVSPTEPDRLKEIASAIPLFLVNTIVTMNTEVNCIDFRPDGRPVIDTPDKTGYAGGSGESVFHKALGQVHQWRACLPRLIDVWGVGGVQSGEQVRKMQWAGASAVQVGTAYFVCGTKIFGDIANQFINKEG